MTEEVKLSKRLLKVASYLPKGAIFADIGSDHAYLPCFVCRHDVTALAIAGEVRKGPFSSAKKAVTKYQLNDRIDVRLGDGLAVLKEDEVNQVVIAGMGGELISSILENGQEKLGHVDMIISQPNIDEENVRIWYNQHGYQIHEEALVEENGHLYEVIIGKKSTEEMKLTEKEIFFGPYLLKQRPTLFIKKWQQVKNKMERALKQMGKARVQDTVKIKKFTQQLAWIEEVLGKDDQINNK